MLRDRKASTAEGSFSSFTGGELFKPCLAFLAILKLLGEEAPNPERGVIAQVTGREEIIVGMEVERSQVTGSILGNPRG